MVKNINQFQNDIMKKDLTIQAQKSTIEELKKDKKDLETSTFEQSQKISSLMKNNQELKNQRATIISKYKKTDSILDIAQKKNTKELFQRSIQSYNNLVQDSNSRIFKEQMNIQNTTNNQIDESIFQGVNCTTTEQNQTYMYNDVQI